MSSSEEEEEEDQVLSTGPTEHLLPARASPAKYRSPRTPVAASPSTKRSAIISTPRTRTPFKIVFPVIELMPQNVPLPESPAPSGPGYVFDDTDSAEDEELSPAMIPLPASPAVVPASQSAITAAPTPRRLASYTAEDESEEEEPLSLRVSLSLDDPAYQTKC